MAEGSRRYLAYVEEETWGTTPGTPKMKYLRNTGGPGIAINRQAVPSSEFRQDRQIPDATMGANNTTLQIPFELSYESFDDMLEAALFGEFAVAYALTDQTVTVVASTHKFSRAEGSWITDGVKVGDAFVTTGFEAAGNNGTFIVTDVSALEVTCGAATGLVNVSSDTGVGVTTTRQVLKAGVTEKYFTFEEGFDDIEEYRVARGMMVNQMTLRLQPNAIVTGQFDLIGAGGDEFSATPLDESPTAASTNKVFNAFSGEAKEGDAEIAILTSIELTLANGLEAKPILFDRDPQRIGVGRSNLTFTVSLYFIDSTLRDKHIKETESSLEFTLEDTDGNKYVFLLPRTKYTGDSQNLTENDVVITLSGQALLDSTEDTNFRIDKIPA